MKKSSRIRLIYARYIVPPIMLLLTFCAMFIPSYQYVVEGKLVDKNSLFALVANSFDTARHVVFATAEQDAAYLLFSRIVMIFIIVSALLFLLAFAVSIYSAFVGFRCILSDDEQGTEKIRTFFITLIPNRIFLCILEALCIPITLFPYVLPRIWDAIWSKYMGLALMAPDALIVACVSVIATVSLCIVSAPSERLLEVDVFKKSKKVETDVEEEDVDDEEEILNVDEEQRERIRRMLVGIQLGEENTENTDKTEDTE